MSHDSSEGQQETSHEQRHAEDQTTAPADQATPNPTLEQWKTYVQTTLNVSNRRLKNNRFYQRLLGVTVAGVGVAAKLGVIGAFAFLVVGAIGVAVSLLWMVHVISYKQLNSGKYTVLHEIEAELPHNPFAQEWDVLDQGRDPTTYVTHTSVEIWWPRVSLWVFGGMALYGIVGTLQRTDWTLGVLAGWTMLILAYWIAAFRGWKPFTRLAPYWKQRSDDDEP